MNTKIETIALNDTDLDMVAGGGFLGDLGGALKTGIKTGLHYGAYGFGVFGDVTSCGGGDSGPKMAKTMDKITDWALGK